VYIRPHYWISWN